MTNQLTPAQRRFLEDLFPGDASVFDPAELTVFGADSSRRFAMPWAAVRPENEGQVRELLRWAEAERMPVYTRARGTNMVGAAVPSLGGVVLSTLRMNRILDISAEDFVAEVEPGVVNGDLQAALADKGLFYPPDPASWKISTLGGNVATCAGGMRAVKYGVTRDYVLGLTAVLPGGRVLTTGGRNHKDVVGLDVTRLFVGSAGSLGVITRLVLKLIPRPAAQASALASFPDLRAALEGSRAMFRAGILPTACELMDHNTIKALSMTPEGGGLPLDPNAGAALLVRVDGSEVALAGDLDGLAKAFSRAGALRVETGRGADEDRLWEVRSMISPSCFHLAPRKISEDVAVPRGKVVEAVEGFVAAGARNGVEVVNFGHLGDGNIHVNVMFGESGEDEVRAGQAVEEMFALTLSLGGTISGEHGTGLTKKDHVADQIGTVELDVMRSIKAVFDPHGIMNPGKGW